MAAARIPLLIALVALSFAGSLGSDPSSLQDFCVADKDSQVFVNGVACKSPNQVTVDDFYFSGLDIPGNTSNKLGSAVNLVNVQKLPGLNTLGISLARLDYGPYGLNPPHTHPRATEVLAVLEGSLYVGFVATDNKLFAKVLNKGDVYVFPEGLVHFQYNYGTTNAVAFAGLSSQNPGVVRVADALFATKPPVSDDVLTKAFRVDANTVHFIQSQFQ